MPLPRLCEIKPVLQSLPITTSQTARMKSLVFNIFFIYFITGYIRAEDGTTSTHPTWPSPCTFTLYSNQSVDGIQRFMTVRYEAEGECMSLCAGDERCGMFEAVEGRCRFYQVSARLLEQATGRAPEMFMRNMSQSVVGSRDCEAVTIASECNLFPVEHDRQTPPFTTILTSLYRVKDLGVRACERVCVMFSDCTSVLYRVDTQDTYCHLFNTTISHLVASGLRSLVMTNNDTLYHPVWSSYERFCADDEPYIPHNYTQIASTASPLYTTVTSGSTPTNFYHINGLFLLIPSVVYTSLTHWLLRAGHS